MREALRYLTPQKFTLFLEIPFLLHINAPGYPGFIPETPNAHGVFNFRQSGFFKLAMKEQIFPKSIQEYIAVNDPCILSIFHIGSLGTFTQSVGSDFDYWIMIDKKRFNTDRYAALEKKLDAIVKYCREIYQQEVSFFIMDSRQVRQNDFSGFDPGDTVAVPQIFLKEEFYRTYLMIAGKIPLWSVLPSGMSDPIERQRISAQILSVYDDIIDLGPVDAIPFSDILKGLLWHICKSVEDPVKALIKSTLVFSYGFGRKNHQILLCDKVKNAYRHAGIDDYAADPYKVVFDRIMEFHESCDPSGIHLIKNAVFFRLCGYPDVSMPDTRSPKYQLLTRYTREWKLNHTQVNKLLSFAEWSESEKILLEKAILQRLAQMYNIAEKKAGDINRIFITESDRDIWTILKNKTRTRLKADKKKIGGCSTYLKKKNIRGLVVAETTSGWKVMGLWAPAKTLRELHVHNDFTGVFGWILENQLYRRQRADLYLKSRFKIFESSDHALGPDAIYLAASPVKPMSDRAFAGPAINLKLFVFMFISQIGNGADVTGAEILILNSWGEIFTERLKFDTDIGKREKINRIAILAKEHTDKKTAIRFFQLSEQYDPDMVYELKKKLEDISRISALSRQAAGKPYLDRL